MSMPNVDPWGTSENWHDAYISLATQVSYPDIKAIAPQVRVFNTSSSPENERGTLWIGQNIVHWGNELDKSIVPCGQNPEFSPWGNIKFFTNKRDENLNKIPDKEIVKEQPVNWFFAYYVAKLYWGEGTTYNRAGYNKRDNQYMRYYPNPLVENSTTPYQRNLNTMISPFVYYQLKSILLRIYVILDNDTSTGGNWYTLRQWKDNYSNTPIREVMLRICGVNSYDSQNNLLGYRAPSQISYSNAWSACLADDIDGITSYTTFFNEQSSDISIVTACHTNGYDTTTTFYGIGWDGWENATTKSIYSTDTGNGWCVYKSIPYTTANYERILKMAAVFGCPFSDTDQEQFNVLFTDNNLFLPVIDDEGVATGEYTRGSGNADNPLLDKNSIRDIDYDPNADRDTNTYSNITGFNSLTSGATMTKRYVLNAANVDKLGDDLWTICGSLSSQDFEYFDGKLKDEFLTTNPIDSIISLQRFPFEIPHVGSTKAPIKLGKATATAEGYTTYFPFNSIVFAGKSIFPRFGNCFLDYEPYTSYEIYVPFCGTTKIRAADILGHTLNIQMQIDLFTGSCTAYIMADQLVIETMNGSCGVDQTVSGTQTATINANIYNGILNQQLAKKQMAFQTAGALMPSNWINPIGYAAKGEQTETTYKEATYAIEHVETPPHSIGSASPLLSWCQEFDARIIIYYPEGDVIQSSTPPSFNTAALQAFGHTKGFSTITPGTVSSFHGYTQGTIIADQIPCTESERNRIKEAFASGVFLP